MSSANPQEEGIDLYKLTLEQITQFQKALEEEVQLMMSNAATLKVGLQKFNHAEEALESLKDSEEGQEAMVPLTTSLYVPGKLTDTKSVMVDVGTGYFVDKRVDGAVALVGRKKEMLTKNIESLQMVVTKKRGLLEAVIQVRNQKLAEERNQQANNRTKSVLE